MNIYAFFDSPTFEFFPRFAGRPFPLINCTVSNQSSDSMQVDCQEGFDGGLPQGFLLELVEMPALRLVRNLSLLVSNRGLVCRLRQNNAIRY